MIPNFSWLEPGRVAGMASPMTAGRFAAKDVFRSLKAVGIGALVDLTEEGEGLLLAQEEGFECLHLPIADMCAPEVELMEDCIAFVEQMQLAGGAVAVHCRAGFGRTGTMLAAYLVSKGQPASDAVALVRRLRPGSIETEEQERAVERYAASVRRP